MQIHQFDRATSAENTDLFPISRSGRVYAITEENLVNATADKVNELLATKKDVFTGNIDNITETSVYWIDMSKASGTLPWTYDGTYEDWPYHFCSLRTDVISSGIRIQVAYMWSSEESNSAVVCSRTFTNNKWYDWTEHATEKRLFAVTNPISDRVTPLERFAARTRLVDESSDTRTLSNGLTIVGNKIGRTVQLYIFVTSAYNASTNPNGGLTEALASGSGAVSIFPTGAAKLPEAFQPLVSMVNYTVLALANGGIIGQLNVRGDGDIQISGTRGITDGVTKDLAVHTNLYANMMYLSKS